MNAVRMEYKEEFEKLPRGEHGLFWVLDATLPPMPKKEKAKQATLNIFSVRLCVKNVHAVNLIPCVSHPHVIFVAGRQYGYIRRCKRTFYRHCIF